VGDGCLEREGVRYAVKRLPFGAPGDQPMARLRGQALALAQANPLGFPTIRSFVAFERHVEIVMDERAGPSLEAHLNSRALAAEDILDVALDVGRALQQLHELGERHGAVTLDNIVADERCGWCFRDFGECFMAEAGGRDSRRPGERSTSVSGRDLRVDLLGLGRVLQTCLAAFPEGEVAEHAQLAELAASLVDPASSARAHAGVAAFVRELENSFPRRREGAALVGDRVARQEELERLQRIHSTSAGFATVVFRGGPGSGKTHLVRAFRSRLGSREVLDATCRNWEVSPFGVVRQLLDGAI
jgi:hypothetical protein